MLPNGCFGSSLAYSDKSATCAACVGRVECKAKVEGRYDKWIQLLGRFSDGAGRSMDTAWLTPADKKARKDQERQLARREASLAVFGSETAADELQADLDKRSIHFLDKCLDKRVNPMTADTAKLSTVSKALKAALETLRTAPTHRDTIAQAIASVCGLSASTAKRETDALLSFLKRCNRIALKNNIAEIQ